MSSKSLFRMFGATSACLLLVSGAAQATTLLDNPVVEVHCVEFVLPMVGTRSSEEEQQSGAEDPVFEATDPVPAGEEFCSVDEALADTVGGQSGTRIGKLYTDTGFEGSSKLLVAPPGTDSGGNGCADGDAFGKASFGPNFNNEVESAKGFNSCDAMHTFNWKDYRGTHWISGLNEPNMEGARNKNGSVAFEN